VWPYLLIFGLHLLCQIVYSASMWFAEPSPGRRALWLLFIWGVPIFGIGIAGARFGRSAPTADS